MVPDSSVVAVLGVSADAVPAGLPRQWPGCEIRLVSSGAQLARDAADADVVFLWERGGWLREHWGWSRQLRWVAAPTAGVDWLLFPELIDSDAVLTNAAGVFDEAMAGYTLALVSAICADLPATLRFQAQRQWRHRETKLLSGSRAVILGAGGIGLRLSERIQINAWDQVAYVIVLILITVASIDSISRWLRLRLIGGPSRGA